MTDVISRINLRSNKKLNILLIDDDKDELVVFNEVLAKLHKSLALHYSPDCTSLVYELINNIKLNMIFLDINMPVKNGMQFLKEIKAHEIHRHIPVIMYSVSARD